MKEMLPKTLESGLRGIYKMVEETNIGLKTWITKSVLTLLLLLAVVYTIELYTDFHIVVHSIIGIVIALTIGFMHEGLHYLKAKKLGYETEWFRTKMSMGFTISHKSNRGQWRIDKKKIALAPYYALVPVSIIILLIGIYLGHLGIGVGGVAGILLHVIGWPMEGKDA